MKISFLLSLAVIITTIIIYILLLRKMKKIRINIFAFFISGIICISILIFPLLEYKNIYLRIFASFIYAIRCIGMGQELSLLSKIDLTVSNGYLYFILLNFLFLAVPALTVTFIVAYLEKILASIKLMLSRNKKLYVFSEINSRSLMLAKSLENKKNSVIVFSNNRKDINIKAINFNKEVTDIKFNSNSDITFYMISNNEEKNLNDTLELIDKYKNREKTKIYVINQNEETPIILDSTDKGKITVEIISEKERAIFNLLNNKPLFLNTVGNTISILIVGCGCIGHEFLKDSIWCGIMPNYKLKILVIDTNANIIKENLSVEMPEVLTNYDIDFINEDIKSNKAINILKSKHDINYILVSMDNDDKNIDTAITLRRFFLREFDREPVINLFIENEYKQEEILRLSNEKGYAYNLNAFGSIKDLYFKNSIIDSKLENLATKIHLSYDSEDINLERYNLREYNKRSSRACALHIKYKLYSVLGDKYTSDMEENQKLFRSMYSKDIENMLIENEHNRWLAYTRSIGYVYVSPREVEKYYQKNKHYIHYLARRHPALVEFDKLDDVSKRLSVITSKNIDLKESDKMIIKSIYKSINL